MSIAAELGQYFCANVQFKKKSEDSMEGLNLIFPSGYAGDLCLLSIPPKWLHGFMLI